MDKEMEKIQNFGMQVLIWLTFINIIAGIFIICIPSVSAMDWDNIKSYDPVEKEITIYNYNIIGQIFDIKLAEYKLLSNTDECLINCEASGVAILHDYGYLFSNMNFYDKKENIKSILNTIYISENISYEEIIEDYEQVCNTNKNGTKECYNNLTGTHNETRYKLDERIYNGELLAPSTYYWRIEGNKQRFERIDWIGTTFGKELNEWAWWNSSWDYKKQINLKENDNVQWINYTALITVTYDADMNSDFSDLRFTNADEDAELGYWIQNKTDSTTASVWVNVTLEANVNTTIYMYYGNAGASTTSSRGNVFTKPITNAHGKTLGSSTSGALDNSRGYYLTTYKPIILLNYTRTAGTNCEQINLYEVNTMNSWINITYGTGGIYAIANATQFNLINANADGGSCNFNYGNFGGYPVNNSNIQWTNGDAFYSGSHHTDVNGFGVLSLISDERATIEPTVYFGGEISASIINSELNSPINYANLTDKDVVFDCLGTSDTDNPIANISLIINGTYNITNSSVANATSVINTVPLADGYYNWTCEACDDTNGCDNATERTFWIDTVPTINIISPPENVSNYSTSEIYFNATSSLPVDYWIINYNGTNHTLADINTSLTVEDGVFQLLLYANNSDSGMFGLNDTYYFNVDATNPEIVYENGLDDITTLTIPVNSTWSFNATDLHISTCYYNTTDHAETIVTCNASINTTWSSGGDKDIYFCANDTFGNEQCNTTSITVYAIQYSQDENYETVAEGFDVTFNLSLNLSGETMPSSSAYLVFNDTIYYPTTTDAETDSYYFERSVTIPDGYGNTTGVLTDWYWNFTIDGVITNQSTATDNITIYEIGIDNCTDFTTEILNFSLKDEELTSLVNGSLGSLVEVDINITSKTNSSIGITFSDTWINDSNPKVCIPENVLNNSQYRIDFTVGFDSTDRVWEFYYMDNGTLNSSSYLNSYTTKNINLMDLLTADSTTFLFSFTDEDGLEVDDAIVHTYRKYIGEGLFREIERSRQDDNGDTHVHLVEEDVIYYFMITQYGTIIYTSNTYNAKCLSTPCAISLTASPDETNWSIIDNEGGLYAVSVDKDTRIVSVEFELDESATVNATVYRFNNGTAEIINQSNLTATAGTISLFVPLAYDNSTFFVAIRNDDEFVKSEWVSLREDASDYFGTFGAILGGLVVLAMMLMAVSEGAGFIIFTVLALVVVGIMQLVDLGWMALISIICAGGIILWKLVNRKGSRQ